MSCESHPVHEWNLRELLPSFGRVRKVLTWHADSAPEMPDAQGRSDFSSFWARRFEIVLHHPFLGGGLTAGLVLRIICMRSGWGYVNSDVATGMLMAQAASHGHFYAFLWGQNYGGTFLIVLEAPLVALFGLHLVLFRTVDL